MDWCSQINEQVWLVVEASCEAEKTSETIADLKNNCRCELSLRKEKKMGCVSELWRGV
jgi:hypothetical protein